MWWLISFANAWYDGGVPREKWKDQAERSSRLERQFKGAQQGILLRRAGEIKKLLNEHSKRVKLLRVLVELPHRVEPKAVLERLGLLDFVWDGALVIDHRNSEKVLDLRW